MTNHPGPVLVTGATGFLGSAVLRCLVARGRDVHAFVRPRTDRSHLAGLPVTYHTGDLDDAASIQKAMSALVGSAQRLGTRAEVVHGAAVISYRTADADLSRRVNVEGTRAVLDAAQTAGVARVCHVSSVVTVGFARSASETLDENAVFNGAELRTAYVTTKRAAEDFALAVTKQLEVVVVNPGAIFGRTERPSNTFRFLELLARGRTGPFAPPGSLSAVGVEDVAEGVALALERGRTGRRYLLTESNHSHLALFQLAARLFGVKGPGRSMPSPVWRAVVVGAGFVDRLRPLRLMSPQTLALLGLHFRFDSSRARDELGWRPRPFAEVLREVVGQVSERMGQGQG